MGDGKVGRGGGENEAGVQSMGEMGKDFCPNFLQPFVENIDRMICNDRSREIIRLFQTLTENVAPLL